MESKILDKKGLPIQPDKPGLKEVEPLTLISQAIDQGLDVEKMAQLMELQERWEKKEAAKAYKRAMSDFQSKKPVLEKSRKVGYASKTGGKVDYNFAPLSEIQSKVDPLLSSVGISYRWIQDNSSDVVSITCVVSHVDGHEESTRLQAAPDVSGKKNSIQAMGSTVSYLKRYTLEAALGLSSHKDDDAKSTGRPVNSNLPKPSPAQFSNFIKAIKDGKNTYDELCEHFSFNDDQQKLLKSL